MIKRLIEISVRQRALVSLLAIALASGGAWALLTTPLDAVPDLSDVQVIVITPYVGQAPSVVEDQVTYPLTTALLGVPKARNVRGFSFFGVSMVYVIFDDGTDLYWARARVQESLSTASSRLPRGITPRLGPDASGVGWVLMYTLGSPHHDLSQLRSLQDWFLRYELTAVPGVAEVASVGGYAREYQVQIDPDKLRAFDLSLSAIKRALIRSNRDVGGRVLEQGERELMVRGRGTFRGRSSAEIRRQIENVPIGIDQTHHTPILLSHVAAVQIGPQIRRGIAEADGKGEVVSGIMVMRSGENALAVIERVKKRLAELQQGLPKGVEIRVSYDRSRLIERAVFSMGKKLALEIGVVALVCLLFLLHLRSALVAVITVPLGILGAFLLMRAFGINANLMSLGGIGIAIGVMVDAALVMVENLHKHRESWEPRAENESPNHIGTVIASAVEVGPALFTSLAIITISFLPIFALQEQQGRLFSPLAFTKTFAMAVATLLAVTVTPALMAILLRGKLSKERDNPLLRALMAVYRVALGGALKNPLLTLLLGALLLAATVLPARQLGSELMPPLDEGDLLYMPTTPPGISITKAKQLLQKTDRIIASHPQVAHVLGKAGRADSATDPAPLSMLETTILLKPKASWPAGKTIDDIIRELDAMVQFPGLTNAWTMPIRARIDMLSTGIKTPVGIKLLGADLAQLSRVGERIEAVLRAVPGTTSVYSERVVGGSYVDIDVKRHEAARFGLKSGDVLDVVQTAIGGLTVTHTLEGLARYPVTLRFARELRDDIKRLERVAVPTPMGHAVALSQVASLKVVDGPPMIKSENARRTAWIYISLDEPDIGAYLQRAKAAIKKQVQLPSGVSLAWAGQVEQMRRAQERLVVLVPLTLLIILVLLQLHLRDFGLTAAVLLSLPFSLVGGIWWMHLADYNLSVAAIVGFIALAGLAAETGVVMIVYLEQALSSEQTRGELTVERLYAAVVSGAVDRLRPKLMTVMTTMLGLLPIMIGSESGSRLMRRIAAPMIGGVISSALLTLILIPVIYLLLRRARCSTKRS
jgi:Cu(I)/Ag(I) efflux system membrane protein CusA/SilA